MANKSDSPKPRDDFESPENKAEQELGRLVRSLSGRPWNYLKFDEGLQKVLVTWLASIGADGFVAYYVSEEATLWQFTPKSQLENKMRKAIRNAVFRDMRSRLKSREADEPALNELPLTLAGQNLTVWYRYVMQSSMDMGHPPGIHGRRVKKTDKFNFCALVFKNENVPERDDSRWRDWASLHVSMSLPLIYQYLHRRLQLFSAFPPKVSMRYWRDAISKKKNALKPPWFRCYPELLQHDIRSYTVSPIQLGEDADNGCARHLEQIVGFGEKKTSVYAATLSFDLRKSTFCMENTERHVFSNWMQQMVQILRRVGHRQGGVFDKFTGDGGLVHFLYRECKQVYGVNPIEAAVECAVDMQRAIELHLGRLREFIRLDSDLLGGAIGIDFDEISWAIDDRFNPVTVGRGIVQACRLGDPTGPGRIRLTNFAYRQLCSKMREHLRFQQVSFGSKEIDDELKVSAWECKPALGLGASHRRIEEICRKFGTSHRMDSRRRTF